MSKVQAILFSRAHWSTAAARNWLEKNGHTPIKRVHATANWYRYRVREPAKSANYITKDIGHGIQLVIEFMHPTPGRRRGK